MSPVPRLLLPSTLDAQFGTPYPRSASFDTDIGAFIESSAVSSPLGSMAPSIIVSDAVQGETFLPGQIFVFGGFALRANSLGHLEQIKSYAPGHQARFGSLNYMADIPGDLIFDGFEPLPCASRGRDEYDLALPSDHIQEIAPAAALSLNSETVAPSMDGWMDPSRRPYPQRRSSRISTLPFMRAVLPNCRILLRPRTPNRLRPFLSNPIGRRSWSLPPRIFFSTRPSATY